jgi:hypothetical protein
MTVEATFRVIGDGLSIISLSFISSMALTAWKRIPAGIKVPMQWSAKDQMPTWRANKLLALLFTPVMAIVILFVPTLLGATRGSTDLQQIIVVFAVRAMASAAFVVIFMNYLKHVYMTLQDEGSLRS